MTLRDGRVCRCFDSLSQRRCCGCGSSDPRSARPPNVSSALQQRDAKQQCTGLKLGQVEPKAGVLRTQDGGCSARTSSTGVHVSQGGPARETGRKVVLGRQRDQEVQEQQLWQCYSRGDKHACETSLLAPDTRAQVHDLLNKSTVACVGGRA